MRGHADDMVGGLFPMSSRLSPRFVGAVGENQ
jgi:hypothetical protein